MKALWLGFILFLSVVPVARAEEFIAPADQPISRIEALTQTLTIVTKTGERHPFNVEIADTPRDLARGLMFRTAMPDEHGMIFMFPIEGERSFWMKNTLIPLDMIFINPDGTIRHIHENAIPHDETPIHSEGPAIAVLEINGGRCTALGITAGDRVEFPAFSQGVQTPGE